MYKKNNTKQLCEDCKYLSWLNEKLEVCVVNRIKFKKDNGWCDSFCPKRRR